MPFFDVLVCKRRGASTEVSLGYVDLGIVASRLFADGAELPVVGVPLCKIGVRVARVRLPVSVARETMLREFFPG